MENFWCLRQRKGQAKKNRKKHNLKTKQLGKLYSGLERYESSKKYYLLTDCC
jgi:hypothetical protein